MPKLLLFFHKIRHCLLNCYEKINRLKKKLANLFICPAFRYTGKNIFSLWPFLGFTHLSFSKRVKVKLSHFRPEQAFWFPCWGSHISRQSAHEGGKVVSPTHRPPSPPSKYPCYSFLLEAESTPGPQCGRKDYVTEKFQWHHRESNPRPSGW